MEINTLSSMIWVPRKLIFEAKFGKLIFEAKFGKLIFEAKFKHSLILIFFGSKGKGRGRLELVISTSRGTFYNQLCYTLGIQPLQSMTNVYLNEVRNEYSTIIMSQVDD